MSRLFSTFTIRDLTLRNRIVISPMCQYSSIDGFANDWHLVHLGARAVGGASLIIQEATAVSPEGRISYGDMGLWKDEHIDKSKQITSFIHQQGAYAGIQLAHAGRKASMQKPWDGGKQLLPSEENGWQSVSASSIPYHEGEHPPHELTMEEIQDVINDFVKAAVRADKAGYDVVEIHAAHGYLIHQFLSPLSNHRKDQYGGSFENRVRFVLEITESIRKIWPEDKPIFVRISASDWTEGGWTIDDSVKLAALLKHAGADLIDCSSGGNVPHAKITVAPGYQVSFASQIKKQTAIPTAAVGLITEASQAEKILEDGDADLIMIARESLRDPNFPLRAAHELHEKISWPLQYERGQFRS